MIDLVIITHNQSRYIDSILKSIKNQSRKPEKVIIVDANSNKRNNYNIVKKYNVDYYKIDREERGYARN